MKHELYLPVLTRPLSHTMTEEMARHVLGKYYQTGLTYNFDLKQWNRNDYLNFPLIHQVEHTKNMWDMKRVMEQAPWMAGREIAACVSLVIPLADVPMGHVGIVNPTFSNSGVAVAVNLVIRDQDSGRLEMAPRWQCTDVCGSHRTAAQCAGGKWAARAAQHAIFCKLFAQVQGWCK